MKIDWWEFALSVVTVQFQKKFHVSLTNRFRFSNFSSIVTTYKDRGYSTFAVQVTSQLQVMARTSETTTNASMTAQNRRSVCLIRAETAALRQVRKTRLYT